MQLDHDEEMGSIHGMYGTQDAELEVQRTTKRADPTAFLCLLRKAIGPSMVHVENKRIIDGCGKEKRNVFIGLKAKDADLWIVIWEELNKLRAKDIVIEVEYVKAHRAEKERQQISLFEKSLIESKEKSGWTSKSSCHVGWRFYDVGKSKHSPVGKRRSVCSLWKDYEELKSMSQEKWVFVNQKKGGKEASDGVVWDSK